ncbi:MAG: family peptidase [Chryseobacterium sp.]|jgi:predicted metal-dependent hydrolase|nr:family peptidase [Chryseobacterium sp.]
MEKVQYKYGSRIIDAEVTYSNRKTIDLRVFPEGNVLITAPENTDIEKILEKVKPKSKWIVHQQRIFELYKPFATERLYIPGETHRYLGRQYRLVVNSSKGKPIVKLSKGLMIVETKYSIDVEKTIISYYKKRATEIFNSILKEIMVKFVQFKNYDISLNHRFMKKRWGSCSTDGNILLNTELIKASKACIEYVIIHELCHLIFPNHSKDFYNLLSKLLPDWEKLKNKLEVSLA